MKEFLKKETDSGVKLLVALALVNDGRDKEVVPEVIRLMAEVPSERGWRAEELLWRIAGEDGPPVSLGSDKASQAKARDAWKKWWDAHEKKVDLAKLDRESTYGLTIVCESPFRGGIGRVVALGGDGKERWSVKGLNWPMDAVPLAGKKVLIAEHNRNRIVEREIDGKELWSENINQPVSLGRLPNGITWAVGRNQIIEWERGDKSNKKHVFNFIRNEYDIVAGNRLKNGEYVLLTQNQQLLKVDRKGTIVKAHGVGGNGVNYYSTVDVLPNGKVLVTLMNSIAEFDLDSGKMGWSAKYQYATSAVRLRNGNTLVGNQNMGRIVELDKDGKLTKWQYTGTDTAYRPFLRFSALVTAGDFPVREVLKGRRMKFSFVCSSCFVHMGHCSDCQYGRFAASSANFFSITPSLTFSETTSFRPPSGVWTSRITCFNCMQWADGEIP